METIQGKITRHISRADLEQWMTDYQNVLLDLGTGDGRFAIWAARANPGQLAIGVDACRENLTAPSRQAPANALFVIASAQNLPADLYGLANRLSINFPWGSLLTGLLEGHEGLLNGVQRVARPGTAIEVRLNASALAEAGWALDAGAQRVAEVLGGAGFRVRAPAELGLNELRACPTTWARHLAFGRDPRAYLITGKREGKQAHRPVWIDAGTEVTN